METKKNYKKPEYEEVEMISNVALLAGSCVANAEPGSTQSDTL